MSILVTGGAGYIGSHTVLELLRAGYDPVVVDNLSNSSEKAILRVKELTGSDFTFYKADIQNEQAMNDVFRQHKFDAVIHFAGYKSVGESVAQPLMYYNNNVTGTLNLLGVMQQSGVKKIVFSSSATVYGPNNPSPLTENMPLGAVNPYGQTKLMIEQILRDLCASDDQWKAVLLRYFNPIGADVSGMIGEDPSGIPNNLMPYITQVAVGKRERLSVFGGDYGTKDGTGVRDYIHVTDLAAGHIKALERLLGTVVKPEVGRNNEDPSASGAETYNLGTGIGYSVLDVVNAFESATGVQIPYNIVQRRPGDVAVCYADPTKAFKLLGWKAMRGIGQMCADSWNWQSKNPQGYGEDQGS